MGRGAWRGRDLILHLSRELPATLAAGYPAVAVGGHGAIKTNGLAADFATPCATRNLFGAIRTFPVDCTEA